MFLLDDVLFAPTRGLFLIFRELHKAAQQEVADEAENIRNRLSELYLLLETGQLTEQAFDEQEKSLLDRLDELEELNAGEDEEEEIEDQDTVEIEVSTPDAPGVPARPVDTGENHE